jgi:hypothetical protein
MLEGERLKLRPLAQRDLPVLPSIVAGPEIALVGRLHKARLPKTIGAENVTRCVTVEGARGLRGCERGHLRKSSEPGPPELPFVRVAETNAVLERLGG